MKKYMILMAGIATFSFTAEAQNSSKKANEVASENILSKSNEGQYFSLGPVAGFGHSWISGMSNLNFKPAGYLGISLMYSKKEHWGFSDELVFSHEGYSMDYTRNNTTYTTSIDPMYLRMTPKAYYFFGKYGNSIRPKIFLGPSIAIKVAEDQYTNDSHVYYESVAPATTANLFKTVDLGLEGGVGANFKLARHIWLDLDASYYHGLIYTTNMDNMNRNVKINAGLMFGL